jgi:hypothetical protein
MGIWLFTIGWMLTAAVFVFAICAAAARPIPAPEDANLMEKKSVKSEITTRSPRAIKTCHVAAMGVLLAVIATSCATTNVSHRTNAGSSEPVKGATLLMQR